MKILLACAGGMSTSLLLKKMQSYWSEQGEELKIEAVGVGSCSELAADYDIVLIGPQISYRLKEVEDATGLPCAAIPSVDYAIGDCPKIMKLAKELYAKK